MEHIETDIVIAGAGVIGLALAQVLATRGQRVVVLESEAHIGMGTSSRNSEVIHAGLYYQPGSLKARFCVTGNRMMYEFARSRGIQHKQCGKLVVSSKDQVSRLDTIYTNALSSGVTGLRRLSGADAIAMEPNLLCDEALHAPQSGMINTHQFMETLAHEAAEADTLIATRTSLTGGDVHGAHPVIAAETRHADGRVETFEVACRLFINAAGLGAQQLATKLGMPAETIPEQLLGKGNYFKLSSRPPFSMLIYPLPQPGTLGLHTRLDFDERTTVFGPNLEIVPMLDYDVNTACLPEFQRAMRSYLRDADDYELQPHYVGIRPKIKVADGVFPDFVIQGPAQHKVGGVIALYGIESPGLTSSLALAKAIADQICGAPPSPTAAPDAPVLPYSLF